MNGQATVVAECSKCGAKFTTAGTTLGGSDSCTPHSFGPVGGFHKNIVYPTDAERAWLAVLDDNKEENGEHFKQFETDMEQLESLKNTALQEVNAKVESLRTLLTQRERVLEQQVEKAFSDRLQAMQKNVDALNEHRQQNEEVKSQSEDALLSNTNQTERETKIVNDCKQIVKDKTPQIRYIPTELRMTFSLLSSIEQKIQAFGKLNTKGIDSGSKCQFPSMAGPKNAGMFGPKVIDLDSILSMQPGVATFVENAQNMRLSFALNVKDQTAVDEIMSGLCVKVVCENINDDAKENDGHIETVKFRHCSKQNQNYFVTVNKRFSRGITVRWTIQPIFVSPDAEKFADAEGSESSQQTYDIKEEQFRFACELNGQRQSIALTAGDAALNDYDAFKQKFLEFFGVQLQADELLFLSTKDGALTEDAALTQFATPQYVITGAIQSTQSGGEGNPGAMKEGLELPKGLKKITMFAACDGKKKRILLRKKDNQINMPALREQIVSKLFKGSPNQNFALRDCNGEALETDEQLIKVYSEPDQEVSVEKM